MEAPLFLIASASTFIASTSAAWWRNFCLKFFIVKIYLSQNQNKEAVPFHRFHKNLPLSHPCFESNQNQIFHYTRCITPKRVTSRLGHLHVIALGKQYFFRRNVAAVDLTSQRFKPQTSRSRYERVSARPTGCDVIVFLFLALSACYRRQRAKGKTKNLKPGPKEVTVLE